MHTSVCLALCVVAVAVTVVSAHDLPNCHSGSNVGDVCGLPAEQIIPSQFTLGMEEVQCKVNKLQSLSSSDLEKYLADDKRQVPIVIGPNGFYMVDQHHLVRAVFDSNIAKSQKIMHCKILQSWPNYPMDNFWQEMMINKYVWLYDESGRQPIPPDYLPVNVEPMRDDPYRSLSWFVRDQGGYGKTDFPFAEFQWGNFFRNFINITQISPSAHDEQQPQQSSNGTSPDSWSWCQVHPFAVECVSNLEDRVHNAINAAIKLATSSAASSLPGYGQGVSTPPDCGGKPPLLSLHRTNNKPIKINL